jgi:hypothetical protein
MTGPTQPAPRPLPNPGPPPRPSGAAGSTHPGPGPKPEGPSHPVPTGPGRPPTLAHLVGNATKILNAAIFMLGRQWDPTSGPQQDGGLLPSAVDAALGAACTNIRIALLDLGDVADLISARQSTNSASLPGGPFNHPSGSSEGLTPGLDDARFVARTEGSDEVPSDTSLAGSSHLATSPASGGRTPGLADAASHPTAGGTDGSVTTRFGRDAGESSDPRGAVTSGDPDCPDATGVGFTLPVTPRYSQSAAKFAAGINEALARRSR